MRYKKLVWSDAMIRDFWDYEASAHAERYFSYLVGDNVLAVLQSHFPNVKTALDFGCGPGFMMEHLIQKKYTVFGLDFSKKTIDLVNAKFKKKPNFKGAFALEYFQKNKKKFDLITLVEVVEHLNDQYLRDTFQMIHSLLAPGGVCLITTPNDEDLHHSEVFCPQCSHVFHKVQHVRSWSESSLTSYALARGFQVLTSGTVDFSFRPENVKIGRCQKLCNFIHKNIFRPKVEIVSKKQPHLYCIITK